MCCFNIIAKICRIISQKWSSLNSNLNRHKNKCKCSFVSPISKYHHANFIYNLVCSNFISNHISCPSLSSNLSNRHNNRSKQLTTMIDTSYKSTSKNKTQAKFSTTSISSPTCWIKRNKKNIPIKHWFKLLGRSAVQLFWNNRKNLK